MARVKEVEEQAGKSMWTEFTDVMSRGNREGSIDYGLKMSLKLKLLGSELTPQAVRAFSVGG